MKYRAVISCAALIVAATVGGCEKESWDLVSPPPDSDSIMVRLINLSRSGTYWLQLDAIEAAVQTVPLAPMTSSALIKSPADSAFVRLYDAVGNIVIDHPARTRFVKRTYETMILLPSPLGSPRARDADTLVRVVTNPLPLPPPGRAQVRFFNAVADTTITVALRNGCPSGEYFDQQEFRNSGAPRDIPAGEFVVSVLCAGKPTAIVRGVIGDRRFATIVVTGTAQHVRVFLLDELDQSPAAFRELAAVSESERSAELRWMNVSRYPFDSIRIASVGVVAVNGQGEFLSNYQRIPACTDALSDTVELYSNGVLQDALPISLEVGYRYTVIVLDAPNFGAPASRLAVVARDRISIPSDSTEWRVLNALGRGYALTAFLGARLDQRGRYHNGEFLVRALPDGQLSTPVRLAAGALPIILQGGIPERLIAVAFDTARPAHQYILAALTSRENVPKLYTIADDEASGPIAPLEDGVYVQVVNALADRSLLSCKIADVVQREGISPANLVATILPRGQHTLVINGRPLELTCDPTRVVTVVAAGSGSAPTLIVLDSTSLQPTTMVARVRCINAAPDVAYLRMARDQLVSLDQWDSNILADRLAFGFSSRPREFDRLQRINLVFGTSDSPPQELFRPDGSVSFALGRAYSAIFYGTHQNGYNFFIIQEP